MLIDFKIIPHKKQRYETVGDYFIDHAKIVRGHRRLGTLRTLNFRVSRMKDKRYPILVFLHEMIEFFMCRLAGVKMRAIDKFDMEYERDRKETAHHNFPGSPLTPIARCGCIFFEEPGDDPHAPYHLQHQTATACERLIADALGVDWSEYNDTVESL